MHPLKARASAFAFAFVLAAHAGAAPAKKPAHPVPAPAPAPAPADSSKPDKAACIAAHDAAQSSRAGRKLIEARASYVTCSHEACPDIISIDCAKGLREVDEALPTLVLSASVDGHDATDAKVVLDGEHLAGPLDGRAIPVNPGPHVAVFERPGGGKTEVKMVAREGEKNRLVTGVFVTPEKPANAKTRTEGSQLPIVPIAFAGTGVLALGAALFLHVDMTGDARDLRDRCAPTCEQFERDALSDKLVLRNVTFGIGLGALAVAAVTYVVGLRR